MVWPFDMIVHILYILKSAFTFRCDFKSFMTNFKSAIWETKKEGKLIYWMEMSEICEFHEQAQATYRVKHTSFTKTKPIALMNIPETLRLTSH